MDEHVSSTSTSTPTAGRRRLHVAAFAIAAAVVFVAVFVAVYRGARPLEAGAAAPPPPAAGDPLLELARDPAVVASGAEVYRTTCAACHGVAGEGTIGPNLTDRRWIHGYQAATVLRGVLDGYPARGMPGWEPILGREKATHAAAFVLTLRGTEVAGRPPQGEIEEPSAAGSAALGSAPAAAAPPAREPDPPRAQGVKTSTSSMPSSNTRPTNGQ